MYKKKPVVIEAVRWTGDNFDELEKFAGKFVSKGSNLVSDNNTLFVHTLEGTMRAKSGDYIIMGIQGEFYPCDAEIFKKTYEVFEAPTVEDSFLSDDYNLYTRPFREK